MERVDSMKNATRSGGIFSISFISERRLSPSKPEACTQDTTGIGGSGQLQYAEIRRAITPARLTAFDRAAQSRGASHNDAINLYEWNAELASALLLPLHLFEVVLRNAIIGNWVKASHRVTEVQGQCPSWYAGSAVVPGLSPRRG